MGKKIRKGFSGIGDDVFGTDFAGKKKEAAEKQAKETARQQAEQALILRNTQANMAADLAGDNIANVVAAGTAESLEPDTGTRRRRRPGGLTAALGV